MPKDILLLVKVNGNMSANQQGNVMENPEFTLVIDGFNQLSQFLWDIRTAQDIKQKDVAKAMGVGQGLISALERSDKKNPRFPDLKTIIKYCNAVGFEVVLRPNANLLKQMDS